jgi:phosphoribosylformylglycinamidine synthase
MVKACVLFAAGTNCDRETVLALESAGARAETVHVNQLLRREKCLADYHLLVLPGGFSYGDYIASGRVLANELRHNLQDEVRALHARGGLILGICNGFQVLVKAGLLPAFETLFEPQSVTLDTNESGRYEDRWVYLSVEDSPCVFTRDLPALIRLPVAHAEGRFLTAGAASLGRLQAGGQVVLRYVSESGDPPQYPENPNGSELDIAGVCDPTGRIFGLMPHPERCVRPQHVPDWHRTRSARPDGVALFRNAVACANETLRV